MKRDFVNCSAIIYDEKGNELANAQILEYDRNRNTIVVDDKFALDNRQYCELMILTTPAPLAYKGTIHKHNSYQKLIALFKEHTRENRSEARYKVNLTANVKHLIYDNKAYAMHTAIDAQVIDLSTKGLRIRSVPNALAKGNIFQISVNNQNSTNLLYADVKYCVNPSPNHSEYGCRFLNK
ncbi:MAG: PilZ domain-containing protein [Oscillospiraceae bacterium]|nr:PilZ domain-containing protein [Oscillospiraceae bacterium]